MSGFNLNLVVTNNTPYKLTVTANKFSGNAGGQYIVASTPTKIDAAAQAALAAMDLKTIIDFPLEFFTNLGSRTGKVSINADNASGKEVGHVTTQLNLFTPFGTGSTIALETIKTTILATFPLKLVPGVAFDGSPISANVGYTINPLTVNITFDYIRAPAWPVSITVYNKTNYDIVVQGDDILTQFNGGLLLKTYDDNLIPNVYAESCLQNLNCNGSLSGINTSLKIDDKIDGSSGNGSALTPSSPFSIQGKVSWSVFGVPLQAGNYVNTQTVMGAITYSALQGVQMSYVSVSQNNYVQVQLDYRLNNKIFQTFFQNSAVQPQSLPTYLFYGFDCVLTFTNYTGFPPKPWPAQMTIINKTGVNISTTPETELNSDGVTQGTIMDFQGLTQFADVSGTNKAVSSIVTYQPNVITLGATKSFYVQYTDIIGDVINNGAGVKVDVTYAVDFGVQAVITPYANPDDYGTYPDLQVQVDVYNLPSYDYTGAQQYSSYASGISETKKGTQSNQGALWSVGKVPITENQNCYTALTFTSLPLITPNALPPKTKSTKTKSSGHCSLTIRNGQENIAFNYDS